MLVQEAQLLCKRGGKSAHKLSSFSLLRSGRTHPSQIYYTYSPWCGALLDHHCGAQAQGEQGSFFNLLFLHSQCCNGFQTFLALHPRNPKHPKEMFIYMFWLCEKISVAHFPVSSTKTFQAHYHCTCVYVCVCVWGVTIVVVYLEPNLKMCK